MDAVDIIRSTRDMRTLVCNAYPLIKAHELLEEEKHLAFVEPDRAAAHALYMLERIEREYALREDLGKAFRWLGFVQGWAWRDGICPIAIGKETNRPRSV